MPKCQVLIFMFQDILFLDGWRCVFRQEILHSGQGEECVCVCVRQSPQLFNVKRLSVSACLCGEEKQWVCGSANVPFCQLKSFVWCLQVCKLKWSFVSEPLVCAWADELLSPCVTDESVIRSPAKQVDVCLYVELSEPTATICVEDLEILFVSVCVCVCVYKHSFVWRCRVTRSVGQLRGCRRQRYSEARSSTVNATYIAVSRRQQ